MIRIISKVDGFRRGGIVHSAQPTEYADDVFTAEQLEAFLAEPMLIIDQLVSSEKSEGESTGDQVPFSTPLPAAPRIDELDDLNSIELADLAKAFGGVTLDPKTDWFDLRENVEAILRAKATAEPVPEK